MVIDKAWLVMTILLIVGTVISFVIGYEVFRMGDNLDTDYNIIAKIFGLALIGFGAFLGYESYRCIKSLVGKD